MVNNSLAIDLEKETVEVTLEKRLETLTTGAQDGTSWSASFCRFGFRLDCRPATMPAPQHRGWSVVIL